MAYQAKLDENGCIVCPSDATWVKINILNETMMKPGSIPDTIEELDMRCCRPIFADKSIPSTLQTLHVNDITDGSVYPPTVRVILRNYSGRKPLPLDANVYIHIDEKHFAKAGNRHYIYRYNFGRSNSILDDLPESDNFSYGEPFVFNFGDQEFMAVECTPRKAKILEKPSPKKVKFNDEV